MSSPTTIGPEHPYLDGRSVRDVVEYSPEQVNEVWCRRILRQILQSLELQYAMQMPHRAITADTIVFHENGEPLLVPDDIGPPDERVADDLTALARVIHYAITQELAPTGPLRGRADGYSDSLVAAVDACMDPDPARRPHTIAALRDLLGIVTVGALPAAVRLPDTDTEADSDTAASASAATSAPASARTAPPAAGTTDEPAPAQVPAPAAGVVGAAPATAAQSTVPSASSASMPDASSPLPMPPVAPPADLRGATATADSAASRAPAPDSVTVPAAVTARPSTAEPASTAASASPTASASIKTPATPTPHAVSMPPAPPTVSPGAGAAVPLTPSAPGTPAGAATSQTTLQTTSQKTNARTDTYAGTHPGAHPGAQADGLPGRRAGLSRWQRWAVAGGGGAVLVAAALLLFAELRDAGSYDHVVLTLPQSGDGAQPQDGQPAAPAPLQDPAAAPASASQPAGAPAAEGAATGASTLPSAQPDGAAPAGTAGTGTRLPDIDITAPAAPSASANGSAAASARADGAAQAGAYKVQIAPWGVVYVDGVDRGVSPPVKRLVLAPGRHTIRVANPNFQDRVFDVDSGAGDTRIAVDFGDAAR